MQFFTLGPFIDTSVVNTIDCFGEIQFIFSLVGLKNVAFKYKGETSLSQILTKTFIWTFCATLFSNSLNLMTIYDYPWINCFFFLINFEVLKITAGFVGNFAFFSSNVEYIVYIQFADNNISSSILLENINLNSHPIFTRKQNLLYVRNNWTSYGRHEPCFYLWGF